VARGVATPESDIDFIIVAEGLPRGRMSRSREFIDAEKGILERHPALSRFVLSPIFKTPSEVELGSPLFWDMTEDAII
jgi:predicted nucleotidyltransferase